MNKNITNKILLVIILLFFATAIPTYLLFEAQTKKISENLGTKLAIEKIQHNNFFAISKLDREIALVNKMASSSPIVKWLKNENDQKLAKEAFGELESYRKIFVDKSYFLASVNSKSYYYNDAKATFSGKEKQFELSENNPKDQWFFETIKANKELQLNVDSNWKLGVVKVWMNKMVYDENSKPLAVLGTGIDLSQFISEVLASNDDGINSFFVDKDGNIQAHQNIKLIDFSSISKKDDEHKSIYSMFQNEHDVAKLKKQIELLLTQQQNYITTNLKIGNSNKLIVLSKIKNIDWIIISIVDFEKLIDDSFFDNLVMVMFVAFILFVVFIVFSLNKLVLNPIRKLHRIVDKVMNGDFNVEFKITTTDELGKLCEHFRQMIDKIKEQTIWLEMQVQERTKELELANKELKIFIDDFDKNVIVSRSNKEGVITYASKAFEKISGYSQGELLGKSHNIFRHNDTPKSVYKDMWNELLHGNIWKGEMLNKSKFGESYWLNTVIEPFFDLDGNHIGFRSISQNITDKKQIEILSEKVQNLFDNADEGFLSFGIDLIVENGYSKECFNIFDRNIVGENIIDLLFSSNESQAKFAQEAFGNVFEMTDLNSQELILSLLPSEVKIEQKTVNLKFKIISRGKCMLILSDVTQKIVLEEEIRQQLQLQKMIVAIVSNKNEFIEIKTNFLDFVKKSELNFVEEYSLGICSDVAFFLRELHTYKGLFSQKECAATANKIHDLESSIKDLSNKQELDSKAISKLFKDSDLIKVLETEIDSIYQKTGFKISLNEVFVEISYSELELVIGDLSSLLQKLDKLDAKIIQNILEKIESLREISLFETLINYSEFGQKIANQLGKELKPFHITGSKELTLPNKFNPFLKSLINLFKNSIDHGIEDLPTRFEKNKDLDGFVFCNFEIVDNKLYLIIGDDGKGLDINEIVAKALEKRLVSEDEILSMDDNQKMNLIFHENFSTKNDVSMISGRGIGLNSILEETKLLGGKIEIENHQNQGLTFKFILPL